jgi:hypothetical protein
MFVLIGLVTFGDSLGASQWTKPICLSDDILMADSHAVIAVPDSDLMTVHQGRVNQRYSILLTRTLKP